MNDENQRGKAPKAGKGVGRKPAPEPLKPLNVKIPVSCWEWTDKHGNKSAYIARLITDDLAKSDFTEWLGGDCPVSENTMVECKLRDGRVFANIASDVSWEHRKLESSVDVVGYRVC